MAIDLKLALADMKTKDYRDGGGTFGIVFLTANRDKKTGGEIIRLTNAHQCGLPPNCKGHEMRGVKDMATGKPYAVHNRLIFEYNGEEIFWV